MLDFRGSTKEKSPLVRCGVGTKCSDSLHFGARARLFFEAATQTGLSPFITKWPKGSGVWFQLASINGNGPCFNGDYPLPVDPALDKFIMEKREQRAKALADQEAQPTSFADLK